MDYCHRRLTELVATTSTYCGIEEIKTQPHEGQHSIIKVKLTATMSVPLLVDCVVVHLCFGAILQFSFGTNLF